MNSKAHPSIAIAGNPNCGKTTIFNALTGSDQRVGNWPGVTVEKKSGKFTFPHVSGEVIDLPGIYSLSPDSEDEIVARRFLASAEYDVVINVIDASNLVRNLYLTTQLREMDIPMIIVINKQDLAAKHGLNIDAEKMSKGLGAPVISISAVDEHDIARLKKELSRYLVQDTLINTPFSVSYGEAIERFIASGLVSNDALGALGRMGQRSASIALLEDDPIVIEMICSRGVSKDEILQRREEVYKAVGDDLDIILAERRYAAIDALEHTASSDTSGKKGFDLDRIVMHRYLGVPVFFAMMYLVFMVTITLGGAFIDFFDILFGALFVDGFGALLSLIQAPEWVITFLAGGVGGGIQTIATFIPIIFFMFLMLGILEDSGYMARAAFVMDRFMRFVGLPGKAFVPMLVGFGCTVPAIMATRTLDSRRDRFLAIFMVPFMSCGARLPVYALFAAAFFSTHAGLVVFSIYMAGILLSIMTGMILKRTLFKGEFSPFIMELPEYHIPKLRKVMKYSWDRLTLFMFRAGKVIIVVVCVLTLLGSFGTDGSFGNEDSQNSVLAAIGKTITPIFGPMGITEENWPATVGLFTGIFAKEAVVGTLNSLYLASDGGVEEDTEPFSLSGEILAAFSSIGENLAGIAGGLADPLGFGILGAEEQETAEEVGADSQLFGILRAMFTPAAAYAYLLFILIYFPCVAALGAVFREAGRFYGILLASYLTILAWVVSVFVYQIAEGHSPLWITVSVGISALIYLSLILLGKREDKMEAALFL
jgi:ferrous iron transport protein B